jgi:hypothetical protein
VIGRGRDSSFIILCFTEHCVASVGSQDDRVGRVSDLARGW